MTKKKKQYEFKDFQVISRTDRIYGSGSNRMKLSMVKIKNKKTGKIFHDWVRPVQLRSAKSLNALINWEQKKKKK